MRRTWSLLLGLLMGLLSPALIRAQEAACPEEGCPEPKVVAPSKKDLKASHHKPKKAEPCAEDELDEKSLTPVLLNAHLKGRVVDFTHNHLHDNRMWSRSLYEWRDLYVYLPPCYDKKQCYPFMMFLHGFAQDEKSFLHVVRAIDAAIVKGCLPPMIIAAPDGTLDGCGSCKRPGSFFINSHAGPYEDYILQDVWDFVTYHYPVRPEREAHVLAGVSMGGFGAFNLGMRYRNCFGSAVGVFPPLNLRWQDCQGNPKADFDPHCWGWRESFDNPREIVGTLGAFAVRLRNLVGPVFGYGPEAAQMVGENNPIELIDRTHLCNGQLNMLIAYGGEDEFNIDAQIESFLYVCKFRGLDVSVIYDRYGHHNVHTAKRFLPGIFAWLKPILDPYAPCKTCCTPCVVCNPCASDGCSAAPVAPPCPACSADPDAPPVPPALDVEPRQLP